MRSWVTRSPVAAGVALVVVGVIAIFLAWNGAAGVDHVEGQLPYLISGGLVGLGLIGAGLATVNVQARRQDSAEVLARLDEIAEALHHLTTTSGVSAAALTAVPDAGMVVAGRTTYHLPSCHVVAEKDDLQPMTPEEAGARGLTRCRICKPPAAATA
ncbi:MAG: hypothetical protein ACRDZU_11225 [Acidimicrobiales bacterium]